MLGISLEWNWWDWFTLCLAIIVTFYVLGAKNPYEKGSRECDALRLARVGLCLALWSIVFGLIGLALALAAFVLAIIAIIKGRTLYGVGVIILSALAPFAGCIGPISKNIQHFHQETKSIEQQSPLPAKQPEPNVGPSISKHLDIEPIIVKLSDASGKRYLKLGLTILIDSNTNLDPGYRDSARKLLASKTYSQIASVAGKINLRNELTKLFNEHLQGGKVQQVMFTEFIIQ